VKSLKSFGVAVGTLAGSVSDPYGFHGPFGGSCAACAVCVWRLCMRTQRSNLRFHSTKPAKSLPGNRTPEEPPGNELLQAALSYARGGIPVFPLQPRGKEPRTNHGLKDATTEEPTIMTWWQSCPAANIGMPTGTSSGRVVLDVDPRHGGEESYVKLQQQYGDIPPTRTSRTGGGGLHLVFASKAPRIRNSAGKLGPGLDIRGEGGYIVAPPSVHASGKRYEWMDPATPIAELPEWLAALLREPDRPTPATSANGCIPEGQRNSKLASLAGTMRKRGMSPEAIEAALLADNTARCIPPLPEPEVRQIAKSVGKYPPGQVMSNGRRPDIEEEDEPEEPQEPPAVSVFPEIAWREVFQTYREAMQGTTEATDVAHFAALWGATALLLRRKVWIPYGMQVYPNVYLVLFGPTGDRKTTGARGLPNLLPESSRVKILQGIGSGEGVADWLAPAPDSTTPISQGVFLEELSALLTLGRWEGSTLKECLTQVWDCPARYEKKYRKAPINLHEPTLSLLACTTPALFWQGVSEVDLHSGFCNRLLYLTGPVKAPIPLPGEPDSYKQMAVRKVLASLDSCYEGKASLEPAARALWEEFYYAWRAENLEPSLKAATERVPTYCMKLTLVYAALEGTLPTITAEQITAAIAVGRYAVACTEQLLGCRTGVSRQGACEETVRRILASAPSGLPVWKVNQRIGGRISLEEVLRAVAAMEKVGEVIQVEETKYGKPIFSLTRHVPRARAKTVI
jgi:hypothetical protein